MSVFDLHVVISLKKVNKLWNWEKVFCLVCEIEKGRIFRKRKTAHNTIVRKRASTNLTQKMLDCLFKCLFINLVCKAREQVSELKFDLYLERY